ILIPSKSFGATSGALADVKIASLASTIHAMFLTPLACIFSSSSAAAGEDGNLRICSAEVIRNGIDVTFISGIVPPHWKFSTIAASIWLPATAAWCWFGLKSCAAPNSCTSTFPSLAAATSLANCSRFFAVWCVGGNWWLMRIVYSAACAALAASAASAYASRVVSIGFMASPRRALVEWYGSFVARSALAGPRSAKHLVGVLARPRQRPAHAESASAEQQRQQHRLRDVAVVGSHRCDSAALLQVRVVDELVRTHDVRVRQAGLLELRAQLVHAMVPKDLRQPAHQLGPHRHACAVGGQGGVVGELRRVEHAAQCEELLVAHGGDEQLLAAGEREHVVDAPGRHAR